ncbi:PTS IIA-like nitrogen regulatory protein PtsN [Catenovulum sp. SM1970]|uniref:PTS IIA-like nitrogen regulatory protein PtsN n=1 Tax=Marinifaba aquimaris TaxID=2741323 RepID=UPI001574C82B|nr:PTS IIA-like nitrogen regulatory protein PtsN [Marinifaba aquimaris]NTS75888.1 PTS IIA-like nitrogen regulatory protein PtsN [Marinifaba aquimaris]
MDVTSLILPDCVFCAVPVSSKKKLLQYVSQLASKHYPELEEQSILEALLNRERLGSTGIGQGIALPHGRLKDTEKNVSLLVTTEKPIDFDAIDNQPVQVFCVLLAPEHECKNHLSSLAAIAEKLSDKQILKNIKHARDNEALYQAFVA